MASLGDQFVPPTNLGRVDEEMVLPVKLHWCAKIKDEVEKLAYQLNEEAERTERPIRRLRTAIWGFSSGRPRGTTPADDRYIVLQARRNRRQTAGEIARHTTQVTGRPISRFTVARRLHGGGLFARRPVRCVPLTPAHRRRRSLWCREHRNWRDNEWGRVLFTDESRFSLSSDSDRILIWREWGSRNHPSNIIERDRYGGRGVLVWGGIMVGSRTDLHIFDAGSVNGTRYCNEILLPYVRLFRGAMGLQFLFMDDIAPCHRTVAAEQLLESEDIERMDWLARSQSHRACMGFSRQTLGNSYLTTSNDSGSFDWRCKTNGQTTFGLLNFRNDSHCIANGIRTCVNPVQVYPLVAWGGRPRPRAWKGPDKLGLTGYKSPYNANCQVIYSQFDLAIHQNDHQTRRRFVEWAQNEIAVVPDFHKRILFSDEAHFWLNGYVNQRNCRIWSEANPQVYVETPLHPEKLTELWFQQDGATCHTTRATIDLLKHTLGDRLISRFGPVNWPPRSCDLTPLDYFLWGYVKSLVYADKPQTLDHLEDNIRRVIADIRPQMLEKVIENWTSRLDYIRASRGSHMPEILFKM
ncbi:transposable element Tcb2 transposase [Trichonephila clavipes]|nr:transposable element Tcb2 transposase [Trichonephila clavipes]